ncbi:arg8-vasotocin receptor-like [Oppia nitens]|uniref:arg8-vasotocin receptor-like n=1 Tax=Oppia nitens TaxID=1686743 RepID=UPI0023DBB026|nr:arg8-vasotocin receptor-like [Oppia nitens]
MALLVRKPKMNRMYYYLQHLCIGDLMCGFFNVFPQLIWDITYRFYGGNILCKIIKYLQILGPYLSSYILVITAIDRYQAICHPLMNCSWTQQRSQLMILMAWILSLIMCCPQIYIFSYQRISPTLLVYDCWATFTEHWERIYVTCNNDNAIDAPVIVKKSTTNSMKQIRGQTKRHTEVRKCRNSLPNISLVTTNGVNNNNNNTTPRSHSLRYVSRAKIKTVKITIVIMLFYVLCSLPFICVQLWVHWFPQSAYITSESRTVVLRSGMLSLLGLLAKIKV